MGGSFISLTPAKILNRLLLQLPAKSRRLLLVLIDVILISFSAWLCFWLRSSTNSAEFFWIIPVSIIFALPLYIFTGQYQGLTRYVGSPALYRLIIRNLLLILFLVTYGFLFKLPLQDLSGWVLYLLLIVGSTGFIRFILRDFLLTLPIKDSKKIPRVAIFGAGSAGAQLAAALRLSGSYVVEMFIDDAPHLWGRNINGVSIYPRESLLKFHSKLDKVLLAIPSLSRNNRREIIEYLHKNCVEVLQPPSIDDLTKGVASIDTLRPIEIEDLLGRDIVEPDPKLLGPGIEGNVVCITGAGGSIGGELCRQIACLNPSKIVLFEINEPSLYKIQKELNNKFKNTNIEILPIMGNACDPNLLLKTFKNNRVRIVFHAAAYKHVPLVEINPFQGISNNFLSTKFVCEACVASEVDQMILISSDKAVRPTNVMGASKRLSELVIQSFAEKNINSVGNKKILFSMVRFGNVLGSSGSVVPLFREQITNGGPITLTHKKIIRYFMTIPEAALLVIQSAVLAKGGDLFLLDMGEPVLIYDLACKMINLSGLTVKDFDNPNGDIEIITTGLRPGEKLFEELLIDGNAEKTTHPLIYQAKPKSIPYEELFALFDELQNNLLISKNEQVAISLLSKLVPEWTSSALK
tara:strand:- start:10976 stop:12883 length:1908 start_codon:yes stop_codon:yes gene_type:complete